MSAFDAAVLIAGGVAAFRLDYPLGHLAAVVVIHFFLFCNVFRIARALELCWAGVFLLATLGWAKGNLLTESLALTVTLAATATVIVLEMRKPSYHGVGWRWLNPRLREWWEEAQRREDAR